ncbi:inorganic phosphate transporter [candidate division KSB1 bacterium]|nr:inorganic phosphate transporter [candidate division KSB1 bacterium]
MAPFYLSSGLFLGWSLGANDAANVFGTAVGTKMVRFRTAALITTVFVIFGAVISGAGATKTLTNLGAVDVIAGSFMVAAASAFTVFWMSRLKVPVSTSQAIVGGIVGWNVYTGTSTDSGVLTKIVLTWMLCPLLAGVFAIVLFILFKRFFNNVRIHLLRLDLYTRVGLIFVGAFSAYSLGANNIANVMGVFVPVSPFQDYDVLGYFTVSGAQQLFLIGAIAIGVGVFTYSHRVMQTVGSSLFKLSPEAALVVVLSHALVLFLFASQTLANWLTSHGLPAIPLVPVSSTQAVIGAILGIGVYKGATGIHYGVLGEIALGWVTTPVVAGVITFVSLFFLENVFNQEVSQQVTHAF